MKDATGTFLSYINTTMLFYVRSFRKTLVCGDANDMHNNYYFYACVDRDTKSRAKKSK